MKPGQKKEIKLKLQQKSKKLVDALNRINDLEGSKSQLGQAYTIHLDDDLKKELDALKQKITLRLKEIRALRDKLEAEHQSKTPANIIKFAETLKKECSEILKIYKKEKHGLYRGTYMKGHPAAFKGSPRKDRSPMTSEYHFQELFDYMLTKLKSPVTRSNCIFAVGSIKAASGYGTAYLILPVNGSSYLWSPQYDDLIIGHNFGWHKMVSSTKIKLAVSKLVKELGKDWFNDFFYTSPADKSMKAYGYYLKDYINHQLMDGQTDLYDELVARRFSDPEIGKLRYYIDPHVFKAIYQPQINKNIGEGIGREHEMMITGNYYAINTESDLYSKMLELLGLEDIYG